MRTTENARSTSPAPRSNSAGGQGKSRAERGVELRSAAPVDKHNCRAEGRVNSRTAASIVRQILFERPRQAAGCNRRSSGDGVGGVYVSLEKLRVRSGGGIGR